MINQVLCPDAIPGWFNMFDFSIAPSLLFYSYIPIIVITIFLSLYILFKDRFSLQSKLLFGIAVTFSIWAIDQIAQWTAVYVSVVHFSWQIIALFEILIFIFALYFVAVFVNKKDINFKYKLLLGAVLLPVVIFLPTRLNITSFDFQLCESGYSYLWHYIYIVEVCSIVIMMDVFFRKYRSLSKGDPFRVQIAILAVGMFLFLGMFTATNVLGDSLLLYEINLIGPIGMVAFIGLLTFMMVRFKTFNIKLVGAQALIISLIALIGSQFFFIQNNTNRLLTAITLIITGAIGINLIRSVKKEVAQRERIEKLNTQLEGLIHFIGHEVKGYLTKSQGVFSMIVDGDYGEVSSDLKKVVGIAMRDNREGVDTVMGMLNAVNVKNGNMKFNMEPFDLKTVLTETVAELKQSAEIKGLSLETKIADADYNTIGDREQISKHVIRNLIDNSIKYTREGGLTVTLERKGKEIIFAVKDTGVGITDEDKARLFTEGGRGINSVKVNVHSTGYGLFFAKGIVDAHKGRIWAESPGQDRGSTFFVGLPASGK